MFTTILFTASWIDESILAMQARAMLAVDRTMKLPGKGARLLISHGDVLKAIVAAVLGMELDQFQKLVIDPASITILEIDKSRQRLLLMNDTNSNIESLINAQSHTKPTLGGGAGATAKKVR